MKLTANPINQHVLFNDTFHIFLLAFKVFNVLWCCSFLAVIKKEKLNTLKEGTLQQNIFNFR